MSFRQHDALNLVEYLTIWKKTVKEKNQPIHVKSTLPLSDHRTIE